jgi:hypothetical protein
MCKNWQLYGSCSFQEKVIFLGLLNSSVHLPTDSGT